MDRPIVQQGLKSLVRLLWASPIPICCGNGRFASPERINRPRARHSLGAGGGDRTGIHNADPTGTNTDALVKAVRPYASSHVPRSDRWTSMASHRREAGELEVTVSDDRRDKSSIG